MSLFINSLSSYFLLLLLFISAISCIFFLVRTIYIIAATPVISHDNSLPIVPPLVSILLPVRNEASRILRQNIESLTLQTYPELEIVVVDDRSIDQSLRILRDFQAIHRNRIKLIEGRETESGWLGKTFALHQAKENSSGEWLLAVDADVIYSPHAVSSALSFALHHKLDALSLLPQMIMITFWEIIIMPVMCWMSLMRVSPTQANRRTSKSCFGFGNFILFQRTAHNAIGGFCSYRGEILDDCAIMERLKRRGCKVMVANGPDLLKSRMYHNLGEIVQGFGKNSFAALGFSPSRAVGVILAEILFIFFPPVFLLLQVINNKYSDIHSALAIVATVCFSLTMLVFGLKIRAGLKFYPLYLLGHVIALVIICYSLVSFISGRGVAWKGRVLTRI